MLDQNVRLEGQSMSLEMLRNKYFPDEGLSPAEMRKMDYSLDPHLDRSGNRDYYFISILCTEMPD